MSITNAEFCEGVKELMDKYDEYKEKFIKMFGNDKGYDEWFTHQTFNKYTSEKIKNDPIRI